MQGNCWRHNRQDGESDLTIPANIIQLDFDNRRFVWRVANGKAEKAYIRLGEMTGGNVTLTEGLKKCWKCSMSFYFSFKSDHLSELQEIVI